MKKFLIMGFLAVVGLALAQQQASAWVNCKFGVGLNWQFQSGGNSCFWGAFVNGQPPGSDFGQGGFGNFGPEILPHGQGDHAYYMPQGTYPQGAPAQNAWYYTQPPFRTVTYPGYYTAPSYYYPVSGYYGR